MNREQHLEHALKTWDPERIRARGYLPCEYLRTGLLTELGELLQLHKRQMRDGYQPYETWIKELGDCLWYATVYTHKNKDFFACDPPNVNQCYNEMCWEYGDPLPLADPKFPVTDIIFDVMHTFVNAPEFAMYWIEALIMYLGFDLAEVRSANIAKLADRVERGVLYGKGDDR